MIIVKNNLDKTKSQYQCDMCKKIIKGSERLCINVQKGSSNVRKKKWDVCERCYNKIDKAIERYNKEKEAQKK